MDRRWSGLSRRQFMVGVSVGGLGLLTGCGRLPWQAQAPPRHYRIGILVDFSAGPELSRLMLAFLQRLREHDYVEGQNLTVEYRSAQFDSSRRAELAAELVQLPADIILAGDTSSALAAARATSSIPIVTVVGDPVRDGLAASYARPGGNITGFTSLDTTLAAKRLELLSETVGNASRIAVLWNASNTGKAAEFVEIQRAAPILGLELMSLEVRSPEEFETAFEAAQRGGADALVVLGDQLTSPHGAQLVALATRSKLPAIYEGNGYVRAGGLMSYAFRLAHNYIRAADYVNRILKGAKPAELPVEQPREFDFAVNMSTARALGITFPKEIMLQVTEAIQ
jgi:putative tryptophan/tyrosine transport system substrate-binding protein